MYNKLRRLIVIINNDGLAVGLMRVRVYIYETFQPLFYKHWIIRYDRSGPFIRKRALCKLVEFSRHPKISIVMPVYNPHPSDLTAAIDSVRKQVYPNWELCIADDASDDPYVRAFLSKIVLDDSRIKVVFRPENGHISVASNSALELATGEYIALMDHDDLLSPLALFWIAEAIDRHPNVELIYSDEDKIDRRGRRHSPHFKPDWNEDLFLSCNYFSHLGVFRTRLLRQVGGFRPGFEGAQDYDLVLRCIEYVARENICHIPRILYHWRAIKGSTALDSSEKPYALQAGKSAIEEYLQRNNIDAVVENIEHTHYRVCYQVPKPPPKVSIIIPTRDMFHYLKACIDSITALTSYENYEILIVDNDSCEAETLNYLDACRDDERFLILKDYSPFNYSHINNLAAGQATGDVLVLMNNDTEVLTPEWLDEMVSLAMRPGTGAVGARLWYAGDTLQHGGVLLGVGGVAQHAHRHLPKGSHGYFRRAELLQNFAAVTGACLAVRKELYLKVGGLDENLPVAFNDVDFCLKLQVLGYRNTWTPYAELYHYESISRGNDTSPEKRARLLEEEKVLKSRYLDLIENDPYYNPNLTVLREDFSIAWPPRTKPIS